LPKDSIDNDLIESTLELSERAFRELFPILPKEWLNLDLSTPQLKVVLLLLVNGPCRMSVIATALGVSLATGTGVVDRLVERGIVVREGDPEDRRVVLCRLSSKGEKMLLGLVQLARNHAEMMFRSLSVEKLMAVRAGLEALLEAGEATKDQLGIGAASNDKSTSKPMKAAQPRRPESDSRPTQDQVAHFHNRTRLPSAPKNQNKRRATLCSLDNTALLGSLPSPVFLGTRCPVPYPSRTPLL
jgi:DNA-binding MarR family transcriptional regulator